MTTKASAADGASSLQYDNAGQLTQSSGPGPAQGYGYDAAGNRSNSGYVTGAYNRLLSDGTYTYEYDAEGNRTKRTNTATGATDEYTWDYRDRLTRVLSRTSGGAVTRDVRYAYDAEDDRVRKEVDGDGDGAYETTENYAYAGGQLALVLDGAGAVQERYLYGPGVDQPLAVERGGSVKWLLADDQGTVRDVLDAAGNVADHLVVDAFGVVVSQTSAAAQPRFVYTGRELDAETGLYQYRARYYDAAAGRFLSEDPSGFGGGDPNLYRYVGNSVTNLTDPSGLRPATPLEQAEDGQSTPKELILEGALEKLYNGEMLTPDTMEHSVYWGEYWSNPEFKAYADDLLWNQRAAALLDYLGDDLFYKFVWQHLGDGSTSFDLSNGWSSPPLDFAAGDANVYFVGATGLQEDVPWYRRNAFRDMWAGLKAVGSGLNAVNLPGAAWDLGTTWMTTPSAAELAKPIPREFDAMRNTPGLSIRDGIPRGNKVWANGAREGLFKVVPGTLVLMGAMVIPGPEDIFLAWAAKQGIAVVRSGGKAVLSKSGRQLTEAQARAVVTTYKRSQLASPLKRLEELSLSKPHVSFEMVEGRGAWKALGRDSGLHYNDSLIYIVRDKKTKELLKVGETERWETRFGEYLTRAKNEGKVVEIEMWRVDTIYKHIRINQFETPLRRDLKQQGYKLLWDDSIPGSRP